MKRALVLTPWAIQETPILDEGGKPTGEVERAQTPEVALLETLSPKGKIRGVPMTEVIGQYVRLPDSPDPNLVMVEVREAGNWTDWHKHDGLIGDIKKDPRFLVIKEWNDLVPFIATKETKDKVSSYLADTGISAHLIGDVTNGGGADITQMRRVLKGFERGGPAQAGPIPIEKL